MANKWEKYNEPITELYEINPSMTYNAVSIDIFTQYGIEFDKQPSADFRQYIKKYLTGVPFKIKKQWNKT